MRKHLLVLNLLITAIVHGQVSMTVSTSGNYNDPYWMASNILVDSTLSIYNMGQNGLPLTQPDNDQIGYFKANNANFPIASGIVMVAANDADAVISAAPGPAGNNVSTTDTELASVLTALGTSGTMYDMVEIEFSFIAQSDSIKFNYVFGSFEYNGFTCTGYNDVFGFFLEGSYINGTTAPTGQTIVRNIATIPGTTTPIAVNTINGGSPTGSGQASNCLSANPNYVAHSAYYNSSNGTITTLDGYTDKFTAQAEVECGEWYTIRLKLANASDNAYTSAVFLEEKSLKGPVISISDSTNYGNSFNDSLLVEGCNRNEIIFSRSSNLGIEMKIPLKTEGNAIEGVDYSTIPDTITLSPGETADTLVFWVYDDNVVEGIDTLVIVQDYVYTECYNYPVTRLEYLIRDKDTLDATLTKNFPSDSVECPGDSIELSVLVNSFEASYTGHWLGDSSMALTRYVQVLGDTAFHFVLKDECGDSIMLSQEMYVRNYVPMVYERDTVRVCPGDSALINPQYINGRSPLTFIWADNLTSNNPRSVLPYGDTAYYTFNVVDGCSELLIDSAMAINMPAPTAGFQYYNDPYVPLRVLFSEKASNEVAWTWYVDSNTFYGPEFEYDFSRPGDYEVTQVVVSDFGCVDTIILTVSVETDFYLYIPNTFTPDGDGLNECFEIKGVGFEGYSIEIFNRWGNPVFSTSDENECWDGTFNGKDVPIGTYSYRIVAQLPFDEIYIKEGTLQIIR